TDPKTELFNMKHWNQVAEMEIDRARRFNRPLSVLLGDLDLLREANNRYGHLMGDQLIRRVAETIRGALREYDVPARFGGDEFAVRSHEGVSLFRCVARLHGILDARPEFLLDPVPCDQDLDSLEPQITLFHLTLSVAALQGAHRVEAQVWQQPRVRDHHLGPLTRVLRHGATIRLCWLGGCAQDPP